VDAGLQAVRAAAPRFEDFSIPGFTIRPTTMAISTIVALLSMLVSACDDDETTLQRCSARDDGGATCLYGLSSSSCESRNSTAPSCEKGEWVCPPDAVLSSTCASDGGQVDRPCLDAGILAVSCSYGQPGTSCGDVVTSAACVAGEWVCPPNTFPSRMCTCFGALCPEVDGGSSDGGSLDSPAS
jgi:hypothetical protein